MTRRGVDLCEECGSLVVECGHSERTSGFRLPYTPGRSPVQKQLDRVATRDVGEAIQTSIVRQKYGSFAAALFRKTGGTQP